MSEKTGRNEPCPCGSGLKYKKCCINNPAAREVEKIEEPEYLENAGDEFSEKYKIIKRKNPVELFELLNGFGLPIDKNKFMEDAARFNSCIDICHEWQEKYPAVQNGTVEMIIWDAAQALWEILMPEKPCMETILEEIKEGYSEREDGGNDRALEIWLSAWSKITAVYPSFSRAFEKIEDEFEWTELSLENWISDVRDLFVELYEESGGDYLERLEKFIKEFMKFFPESEEFLIVVQKIGLAEILFHKNLIAEADEAFEKLACEYPDFSIVYDCWSGAHSGELSDEIALDYEKARKILERGAARHNLDDREELMFSLRWLNREMFDDGLLAGDEEAKKAYEWEKLYEKAPLERKFNMCVELAAGDSIGRFELFVEPVHYFELLLSELLKTGKIIDAEKLAGVFNEKFSEHYKHDFLIFDQLTALRAIAANDQDTAARLIEKNLNADSPRFDALVNTVTSAVLNGMGKRVADICERAAGQLYIYETTSHYNEDLGHTLKMYATAAIFETAYNKIKINEDAGREEMINKINKFSSLDYARAAVSSFMEEITKSSPGQPGKILQNIDGEDFLKSVIMLSFHFIKYMDEKMSAGFMFSNIIWEFTMDFLYERHNNSSASSNPQKYFRFNKYELKDYAFDLCGDFGKDEIEKAAAGLKGVKDVYEFLHKNGVVDQDLRDSAVNAAEWAFAKFSENFKSRQWQIEFVNKI